jgi:hypothetical protein
MLSGINFTMPSAKDVKTLVAAPVIAGGVIYAAIDSRKRAARRSSRSYCWRYICSS